MSGEPRRGSRRAQLGGANAGLFLGAALGGFLVRTVQRLLARRALG